MSVTVRRLDCTPQQVFAVLADPWIYPTWVVGASRLRAADPEWPQPGCKLHHSIGVWPFVLNDETVVSEWDPPRRVVLEAKTRPVGVERVIIDVKARGNGCVVRMEEFPSRGPLRFAPRFLVDAALHIRNSETLRRLEWAAQGRAAEEPA